MLIAALALAGVTQLPSWVERGQAAQRPPETEARVRVAILIFSGVQIIDYAAPYEVMGQAGYDVFTVGETTAPITTAMGMRVTPRYAFADHPRPDILLVPGGNVDTHVQNASLISWIRSSAAAARHVLSPRHRQSQWRRAGPDGRAQHGVRLEA